MLRLENGLARLVRLRVGPARQVIAVSSQRVASFVGHFCGPISWDRSEHSQYNLFSDQPIVGITY